MLTVRTPGADCSVHTDGGAVHRFDLSALDPRVLEHGHRENDAHVAGHTNHVAKMRILVVPAEGLLFDSLG